MSHAKLSVDSGAGSRAGHRGAIAHARHRRGRLHRCDAPLSTSALIADSTPADSGLNVASRSTGLRCCRKAMRPPTRAPATSRSRTAMAATPKREPLEPGHGRLALPMVTAALPIAASATTTPRRPSAPAAWPCGTGNGDSAFATAPTPQPLLPVNTLRAPSIPSMSKRNDSVATAVGNNDYA